MRIALERLCPGVNKPDFFIRQKTRGAALGHTLAQKMPHPSSWRAPIPIGHWATVSAWSEDAADLGDAEEFGDGDEALSDEEDEDDDGS